MAQTGCPCASQTPNACRSSGDHRWPEQTRRVSHGNQEEEDNDWETDHDYVNNASRPWGDREISTASIISELSRSIRECSLGKPNLPRKTTGHANCQSHLRGCKDPVRNHPKDPEGHQPTLCPHVRSSPSLGIERASLFNRNAAEKLDSFFSRKLKAWAGGSAHLSDTYEDPGTPQEEPSAPWRTSRKEHAGPEHHCKRQSHSRAGQARGDPAAGGGCPPCPRPFRHFLAGKGVASEGGFWRQESSRPSTAVSSSARILPRCRISHVQSCSACQAFNRDLPWGMGPLQENSWSLPEGKGERAGGSAPHQRERTGPPCRRQVPERFLKVQQWLEQTPGEDPPAQQQGHGAGHRGSPGTLGWPPDCGSPDQKGRDSWGEAGGCPSLDPTAETRHRKVSQQEGDGAHHQASRPHGCEDTSSSPATCSCPCCERQRPRATLVSGKRKPDPSAEEVAVQLQAENRIPRIVEAFERRTLREAKIVEREKAYQAGRPARAGRARGSHAKARGHQASGGKARRPHAKEEEQEPREEPRPRAGPEGPPKRPQARERAAKPSFMDRLRGHY